MIQCWVIKDPHLYLNVNIPISFPSGEKLYQIYFRVYSLQWANHTLPSDKEERRHYLKQSEILKLSFLSAVRCIDFSKQYQKRDKSVKRRTDLFDSVNPELKDKFKIDQYQTHGVLFWAEFWLCRGILETCERHRLDYPPFKDEFDWWERLLSYGLDCTHQNIGASPSRRQETIDRAKSDIEKLSNLQMSNVDNVFDRLINLSIKIVKFEKENDFIPIFKENYWNLFINADKDHLKTLKNTEMHPVGMHHGVTVYKMAGNNQFHRAYPAKLFKSGRGRKPRPKSK